MGTNLPADTPNSIDAQANPFTIGPAEQSTITAVVRDASNNLVKNAVVLFDLQDVTGGQLSVASSVTDSQGRAQTFYTAPVKNLSCMVLVTEVVST